MKTFSLKLLFVFIVLSQAAMAQEKVGSNPTTITPNVNFEAEATDGTKTVIKKDNGNMGVGTAVPLYRLDVHASSNPMRLLGVQAGTTTDSLLTFNSGGVAKYLTMPQLGSALGVGTAWALTGNNSISAANFLGSTNNASVRFRANNTQYMVLDSVGRVAIGAEMPAGVNSRLYVSGISHFYGGSLTVGLKNTSSTQATATLYDSSGVVGYGPKLVFRANTGFTSLREMGFIAVRMQNVADATRKSKMDIGVYDQSSAGMKSGIVINSNGFVGIFNSNSQDVADSTITHELHIKSTTDPLRIEGLQTGAAIDSVMTVDNMGVAHFLPMKSMPHWSTTGNTGTNGGTANTYGTGTSFVGTTNSQNFIVRTNNVERLRFGTNHNIMGGNNSQATGSNSFAYGFSTLVQGAHSIALGYQDTITSAANFAFVAGRENKIAGAYGFVGGYRNTAATTGTIAIGTGNDATNTNSTAIGFENQSTGHTAVAMGYRNISSAFRSTAFGHGNTVSGNYSFAVGYLNKVSQATSAAIGDSNTVTSLSSFAVGINNTVQKSYGMAGGYKNLSDGLASIALGYQNSITGNSSFAAGILNQVSGSRSVALGDSNIVLSNYSFAVGSQNRTNGGYSVAGGLSNETGATASTAFGAFNKVLGNYSFAAGYNNILTAGTNRVTAIGDSNNIANNAQWAIAIGQQNTITGSSSYAIGNGNNIAGSRSFAVGDSNTISAGHHYSFAFGKKANTSDLYQMVMNFKNGYNLYTDANSTLGVSLAANGTTWASISDRRAKENIKGVDLGLSAIMRLNPVRYNYKGASSTSLGFIAQEMQEVVPEIVQLPSAEKGMLSIRYTELIPVLVKAIQEQQYQIETLKQQNNELKAQSNVSLQQEIETLKASVQDLLRIVKEGKAYAEGKK
jgi:hypothetical protein